MGRTEILVVSIKTKIGFNHLGAPPGKSEAAHVLGDVSIPEINIPNQRGSAKVNVKDRCLVILNIYGISPVKFNLIKIKNRGVIIVESPLSLREDVCLSCEKIKVIGKFIKFEMREGTSHIFDCVSIINIIEGKIIGMRTDFIIGKERAEEVKGSNEEKMSVNMQDLGKPI